MKTKTPRRRNRGLIQDYGGVKFKNVFHDWKPRESSCVFQCLTEGSLWDYQNQYLLMTVLSKNSPVFSKHVLQTKGMMLKLAILITISDTKEITSLSTVWYKIQRRQTDHQSTTVLVMNQQKTNSTHKINHIPLNTRLQDKPFLMSSRLFVKNIPKHVTEERLKNHFSQKGIVTDVKILKRKLHIPYLLWFTSGVSRQIGFVGFKNEEDAKAALDFFNQTYLDTSKLTVELAASVSISF